MTLFWVFSIIFAVLAAIFVLYPFRSVLLPGASDSDQEDGDRKTQNIQIFEERRDELVRELEAGNLDSTEFETLELELKRELLIYIDGSEDVTTQALASEDSKGKGTAPLTVLIAVFFVLASSYALYFKWGAYDLQAQHNDMRFSAEEAQIAEQAAQEGDMETLVQQLYSKLKNAPDNIEGWTLLGRTSMNMQKYDLAIESYEMVAASLNRQQQNPAPVYGMIAQAYYFKAGAGANAASTTEIDTYLNLALSADPQETNAIGLKAIMAFEQGNYPVAIQEWQKLLEIDPEHESGPAIRAGIARAEGLLAIHESSKSMPSESPQQELALDDTAPGIPVVVSLSEALKDQVSDTDTVFVFAKAIQGPPMPLAAARAQVKDLPLSVRLDKSSAMMPSLTIETVDEVSLTARISKSGQPTAQAGDLYVSLGNVSVKGHSTPVELEISTVF